MMSTICRIYRLSREYTLVQKTDDLAGCRPFFVGDSFGVNVQVGLNVGVPEQFFLHSRRRSERME